MKFAHLADCHIGGWREPKLKELSLKYFEKAIEMCISERVGFVLIAGDLFDSALPSIELLKETARILKMLKDEDVSCYIIPGSHDFSPSGKTMIDVLEKAGLVENVMKISDGKLGFITDKTGAKITGMHGRKGGLESEDYKKIDMSHLENEKGFKIFMFHTALNEFKPKEMESVETMSYTSLPKGFDYYAGGHVHYSFSTTKEGYKRIAFPGPVFPNNFKEMEDFGSGRFCIVDSNLNCMQKEIKLKEAARYNIDADGIPAEDVEQKIISSITNIEDKIVLLRISGILSSGRISDIKFGRIIEKLSNAFVVLCNIAGLKTKEFAKIDVELRNVPDVESALIKEFKLSLGGVDMAKQMMNALDKEKAEGERNADFEARVIKETLGVLLIDYKEGQA